MTAICLGFSWYPFCFCVLQGSHQSSDLQASGRAPKASLLLVRALEIGAYGIPAVYPLARVASVLLVECACISPGDWWCWCRPPIPPGHCSAIDTAVTAV